MAPQIAEPVGEVAKLAMLSGEAQLAEAKRQAELLSRALLPEEKEAIQNRRAACTERRRMALAKVEQFGGQTSPLQERIAQRLAALKEADADSLTVEEVGTLPTPRFGLAPPASWQGNQADVDLAPTTPRFGTEDPDATSKRPRKNRITLSAMNGALEDISADAAKCQIKAAQQLATSVFGPSASMVDFAREFTPRFSIAGGLPPQTRGAKRSVDGVPRSSMDSNAGRNSLSVPSMMAKAALVTGQQRRDSLSSDASDDSHMEQDISTADAPSESAPCKNAGNSSASLKDSGPLLATPGRFRSRTSMPEAQAEGHAGTLPPPPARAPPPHPLKSQKTPALCMRWPLLPV